MVSPGPLMRLGFVCSIVILCDRARSADERLRGWSIVSRQLRVVAVCLLSCAWPTLAAEPPGFVCSPEAVAAAFSEATDVKEIRHVGAIPPKVREAFGVAMADAGGAWESGCFDDGTLPRSQLIFAAGAGPIWMLHFRTGGIHLFVNLEFLCLGSNGTSRYRLAWRCLPGWIPERRSGKDVWIPERYSGEDVWIAELRSGEDVWRPDLPAWEDHRRVLTFQSVTDVQKALKPDCLKRQ
jgi:hypothetical protein